MSFLDPQTVLRAGGYVLRTANILAEWASSSTYLDRIAHLTGTPGGLNNGTFLTPGVRRM